MVQFDPEHLRIATKLREQERQRWRKHAMATSRSATRSRLRANRQAIGVAMMIGHGALSGRRRWDFVLARRATFSTASCSSSNLADIFGGNRIRKNEKDQAFYVSF